MKTTRFGAAVLSFTSLVLAGCGSANMSTTSTPSTTTSAPTPSTTSTTMTVSSPSAGASVSSPFQVSASASACQSQSVTSMGYSIDSGEADQVTGAALQMQAVATSGAHTLHVTAWGADGSACNTDVAINVSAPTQTLPPAQPVSEPAGGPTIPANAITVSEIQQLPKWTGQFDTGTGSGNTTGVATPVSSPSLSGKAMEYQTSFVNSGGERYHVSFAADTLATNFVYDTWVYLASPADTVANVEMDMNQVMPNGQTVIYGFQCDGYSSTWDVTENAGTPAAPKDKWIHTSGACNPQDWTPDTWHHVQIQYSRDNAGNVTYQSVWFDGTEQVINKTVPSAFALGWGPTLLTNLQIDGRGASGTNTVYLDNLTVSRW